MGMIDKVKTCLETAYPSYQWTEFASFSIPSPPYGVVKGEKSINGRGIRVIMHRNSGEQSQLEDDLRAVINLLNEKSLTSRNGNNNQLSRLIDYMDVAAVSDDNTISMEAFYLLPSKSF